MSRVTSFEMVRADGVRIPPFRVLPLHGSSLIAAALRVMVSEAKTQFAHNIRFQMADGSQVIAKPKAS